MPWRWLPVPTVGGLTLLLGNVVNRAKVGDTGRIMPICSFYIKTNIVIPTCVSDDSLPASPSLVRLCVYELVLLGWGEPSAAGLKWRSRIGQAASGELP